MINVTNGKVFRLLVDDEPFDVRYGKLVRHQRTLDLRDGVLRREAEWISPAGQACPRSLDPDGVVRAAVDRRDPVRGRATRRARAHRRPVRAGGERARPRRIERPARGRRAGGAADRGGQCPQRPARQPRPPYARERTADGRRDGSPRGGPRGHRDRRREPARPRPLDREHRAQARREAAGRQVPQLWLVEPAIAALAARPGPPGARRGPPNGLGRPVERAARVPRRDLGSGGHPGRRRRRPSAGGPVRAVPRRPGRRPSRDASDSGQGADRQRLRRPHVLGHGRVHAAGAHVRRPARGARCDRAGVTPRWTSPRLGPGSSGSRG